MTATDSAINVLIKEEPTDFLFELSPVMKPTSGQSVSQYGPWHGSNEGVDPMDLNMPANASQQAFGTSQSLANFVGGNSGVTDDDLLGSFDINASNPVGDYRVNANAQHHVGAIRGYPQQMQSQGSRPRTHQQQSFGNYSHTPEGAPIQSPYLNGPNYGQWMPMQPPTNHIPPQVARSLSGQGINPHERPGSSVSHSPMTPMTPGMGNLQLATPETGSYPGQTIPGNQNAYGHRHSSSTTHWDNSLGSGCSHLDTPLSSPGGLMHPQISEVLRSGTPASPGNHPSGISHGRSASNAEMKKAKRRASHNEVERRRRNHINDQITALSRLVPSHRLEDDAIRRSLNNNASLPSNVPGSGISPPQATSLLAGGTGRRAAGSVTQGLPMDEKDKGPAKGDVLNGSVAWTQDLLWMIHGLIQREEHNQQTIRNLGGQVDTQLSDDERRMRSELGKAFDNNAVAGSMYTRRHGSGLWVPGHTDQAGSPVIGADSPQSMTRSGMEQDFANDMQQSFWSYPNEYGQGRDSIDMKAEDELDLDLN